VRWIGLVVVLALGVPSPAAAVPLAPAGTDSIPPTIASARVFYNPAKPEETAVLEFIFSEPVDWFHAILPTNYTDANTGQTAIQGYWYPPNRTQILFPTGFYGFGSCEQVRVINVKDLAGNTIVDDGVGNVFTFHIEQLLVKGRMSEHMKTHDAPPHSFALEGDTVPLTWGPYCDLALEDADGDSIWTKKVFFSLPCSTATGGAVARDVAFRFSHRCNELEAIPDRLVTLDPLAHPDGRDTLDLWWDDDAPASFTAQDLDVIFRIRAASFDPPFGTGDSLGVSGSELPLSWDAPPPVRLLDDGVAPDDAAGDGIFATRVTFPADTYRNLQFRFSLQAAGDTVFVPECPGEPSRAAYLDDTVYSTTNPLVLDLVFGDCLNVTAAGPLPAPDAAALLGPARPNPARSGTSLTLSLPARSRVRLDVLDVRGRRVRRLLDETRPAGTHRVIWDGRTDGGAAAAAGVYFVRLRSDADGRTESRRVVITR